MDHEYAFRSNAVARYLLDEMNALEMEQYEAHFFQCRLCAQEVKVCSELLESLRAVVASPLPLAEQFRRCRGLIRIYGTPKN
jgi:hypothetical protein